MAIDFSTPMTFYELLAIILAGVAIIIPIIQAIWKKWIVTAKLNYLPTGRAALFFNQSGSYIRIDGVYEAEKKPIAVKDISVKVIRQKDSRTLNLSWSSFISPVNQNVVGNFLQTTESAHPFRIEADSIACAFTEFGDSFNSFGKAFNSYTTQLFKQIPDIRKLNSCYSEALKQYQASSEYIEAKTLLSKEFFWEIGKYDVEIIVSYGKATASFHYEISVDEHEHTHLLENIDESLLSPLKQVYGMGFAYHTAYVELRKK